MRDTALNIATWDEIPAPDRSDLAELKIGEWEQSYSRFENDILYPKEEVVKFLNRFVVKRSGPDEFRRILRPQGPRLRGLDLGCGIGRQLILLHEFGIEGYGIDVSELALTRGESLGRHFGVDLRGRLLRIERPEIPFEDAFFDLAVCDSVLDSMKFELARSYVRELDRAVQGLLFVSLICDSSGRSRDELVAASHEQGTYQSYYTPSRIDSLLEGTRWQTLWQNLVTESRPGDAGDRETVNARFHLVLRNSE